MNRLFRLLLCCASALLILFATSCTTDNGSQNNPPADDGKVEYTLHIKDGSGNPITDGLVTAYSGEDSVGMKRIGDTGTVVFTLAPGNYTLAFDNVPEDLVYDTDAAVFTESVRELTVVFYNKPHEAQTIYATPFDDKEGREYETLGISDGVYFLDLTPGEMNYFIFTPEREGNYRVSATASKTVDIGSYGSPMFVLQNKNIEMDGDTFLMVIRPSYIADGDRETTKFVIGVYGEADSCVLSILYESDYVKTPEDEIWLDVAPTAKLESFNIEYDNYRVTDLNLTDPNLKIVYNEKDGLYHHMTADGPVVLVRIGSASPYLAAFSDICEVTRLCAYLYDENGNFARKESYNSLIAAYSAVADEKSGLYPLTDDIIYVIKSAGTFNQWWDFASERHIFGESAPAIVADNAYLFAACYISYDPTMGAAPDAPITTGSNGNITIAAGSTLHFTSDETDNIVLTVRADNGSYKVTYAGQDYLAANGVITVLLGTDKSFSVTRTDSGTDTAIFSYNVERVIGESGSIRLTAGTTLYYTTVGTGSYTLTITDNSGYVKVTYNGQDYYADSKGQLALTVEAGKSFTIERTDTATAELKVDYTCTKS